MKYELPKLISPTNICLSFFFCFCFILLVNNSYVILDEIDKKRENSLYNNIVSSTVKITTDGEGSGVIIKKEKILEDKEKGISYFSDRFRYYILTAKHIPEEGYLNIVSFLDDKNTVYNVEVADIYASSEEDDILILKLESNLDMGEKVLIPDDTLQKNIEIGTEVFSYGCQNGFYPFLTTGVVSQFDKKEDILSSAPLTPGVSGSGLFIKSNNRYYLIGIASKIAFGDGFIPIHHMGVHVHIEKIKKFLKDSKI